MRGGCTRRCGNWMSRGWKWSGLRCRRTGRSGWSGGSGYCGRGGRREIAGCLRSARVSTVVPMRALKIARLLVLLLVCPLLAGCVTEVRRPTASVRQMSLGEVTPQGFTMNFEVEVENPNSVALPVADVDYNLRLFERDFVDGEADPDASIPANGSMPVTLP